MARNKALLFHKKTRSNKTLDGLAGTMAEIGDSLIRIDIVMKESGANVELMRYIELVESLEQECKRSPIDKKEIIKLTTELAENLPILCEQLQSAQLENSHANQRQLLEKQSEQLKKTMDRMHELEHQLSKDKAFSGIVKKLGGIKKEIAKLSRWLRKKMKRKPIDLSDHRNPRKENVPDKTNFYQRLDKAYQAHASQLSEGEKRRCESLFRALHDLNDNRDRHLREISKEYNNKRRPTQLKMLGKNTPFHIEAYDPSGQYYMGVSVETAINSIHASMENALDWAEDGNRVLELFKNIPDGVCIDGKMRALEDWVSLASQPEVPLDVAMQKGLYSYVEFHKKLDRYEGKEIASADDLEAEDQYVEKMALYIHGHIRDEGLKVAGGTSLEAIEDYVENVLCFERDPALQAGAKNH